MNGNRKLTCAASTQLKWTGLNWSEHQAVVKKLQVRIAKAVKENKWGKVKALQRLLTTSFSAKVLAVRKVTQNKGKNTPGVDGVIAKTPCAKIKLVKQLKRHHYKPKPLRRVYILKKNGKLRPLSIPTIIDRCQQQLHYLSLSPISETTADYTSYGFRPERNCADAIEQCFKILSRKVSPDWIMEGDIKGCFDNISHEWMLNNICMDKVILKKWLQSGYIETKKLFPTHAGAPQGGIISPCLSNFVLDGIDQLLDDNFGTIRVGINLIRYADDFIITSRSKEVLEEKIKPLLIAFLEDRGLELSLEKTKITHINDGFDFLGQNIRKYPAGKYGNKLLIKPSKDAVKAFLKKIREMIRNGSAMTQDKLIGHLNQTIRGWVNYHKSVVSKGIFRNVDNAIYLALYKWTKRRHPKKGMKWVMRKYWVQKELRNYCFSTTIKLDNEVKIKRSLIKATDTPIIRHIKIRNNVNLFDPMYEEYFEARNSDKMKSSNTGIKTVVTLLRKQTNKCICCAQRISMQHTWKIHLITSRLKGGDYTNGNLCIIHDKCHRNGFRTGFVYQLPVTSKTGVAC